MPTVRQDEAHRRDELCPPLPGRHRLHGSQKLIVVGLVIAVVAAVAGAVHAGCTVQRVHTQAETICKASGLPTIADDSGLCVDALNGAPGVYSARYCGRHGDDEANNDKLLEAMKDIPAGQRGAKFVAAVCFILPDGRHLTCVGECPGSVAFARLAGDYGFGYDPLFIPAECGVGKTGRRPNTEGRSYAQLTPDEKDAISHRGNALAEMEQKLPGFLAER